jgi:two-component system sensor kinase FixL
MDAALDAVIVMDHRGRITACNRAASRLFGYAESEMIGNNVGLLMPEPYRSSHDDYLARYKATGVPHIIGIGREMHGARKDGSVFPMFLSVGRVEGDPPRFVGIIRDVTAQHQAKAALESERDRAHAYLELHDSILITLDCEGRIRLINRRGCELLGVPEHEMIGREWLSFVDESDRDAGRQLLSAAMEEQSRRAQSAELATPAGQNGQLIIAWRCIALRAPDGTVTGLLCSGTDVTERRRRQDESHLAQQRMLRVSRLATMGEMASSVAHELNQPLTAIANYSRACERYMATPAPDLAEIKEAIHEIGKEALRAGEIIRRMRRLSASDTAERAATNINDLITELTVLMQADARVHGTRLTVAPAPRPLRASVDAVQIQQVILNLVRNALEAVQERPTGEREVVISTALVGEGQIEIAVSDNGPGVPPEILENLFHPFSTTKGPGRGLSLAMSRSIMQAHAGIIGHRKAATATGACFYIRMPALENETL